MSDTMQYVLPKLSKNSKGELRTMGVELEFAGISPEAVADIVCKTYGGKVEKVSEAEFNISSPDFADFRVELDWQFGRTIAQRRSEQISVDESEDTMIKWMTGIAGQLVPVEVVCPPIPMDQLNILDPMISDLRAAGALGTEKSLLYAFGLHLNPELPNFSGATIISYLQAFIVAQDWLTEKHNVDFSRRITPFINNFPSEYAEIVANSEESKSIDRIVKEYLEFNPTRNRALDMLPLFAYLQERPLDDITDAGLVNARPTFHYRLPNCEIERNDWSVSESWNIWCVIEHLAQDRTTRQRMIEQWHDHKAEFLNLSERPWHQELDKIHQDLVSA